VNPIKLREYLAAGLPVVSVDLPEVQRYENLIKIAKGAEEFVENIECCLRTENREGKGKRSLAMAKEDWNSKVLEIEKVLTV